MLAQSVPINCEGWESPNLYGTASDTSGGRQQPLDTTSSSPSEVSNQVEMEDALIQMRYSAPFDIAWAIVYEPNNDVQFRPPLAVDFGYAVWIEPTEAVEWDSNSPRDLNLRRVQHISAQP